MSTHALAVGNAYLLALLEIAVQFLELIVRHTEVVEHCLSLPRHIVARVHTLELHRAFLIMADNIN